MSGYNFYRIMRPKDKVKTVTSDYTLCKNDLGTSLVVLENNEIRIPRESSVWNGVITIENLTDVTNTFKIDVNSNITIVEYNNTITNYPTDGLITFNGGLFRYQSTTGTFDLNNYIMEIKFHTNVISIFVRTIILDNIKLKIPDPNVNL